MLLAGQQQKPWRALPPSERNCSPAASPAGVSAPRFRGDRGRDGLCPAPPGPPCSAARMVSSSRLRLPAFVSCLVTQGTSTSRPRLEDPTGTAQQPPQKSGARVPGQRQERLAVPHGRLPAGNRAGPTESLE